ncbi:MULTISPECIES: ATP-binding protein, partial [unclassified Streptomyces]|uniref:ATP-binding protein n=1 Tax=unclassified Streptomyces TaxID=2593676 RepID=UPI00081D8097
LADDARLCVTEVVTNSHRHTDSWRIQVDVTVRQRDVTVYVKDDKPYALPVPGNSDTEQEHGRGLLLLENLAAQWGSMVYGGRAPVAKTVWFTLAETRAGAEGSAGTGSGAGA